jgi:hypothetical protein
MPDFGIMRGFNEKLFGDKLVAGQLPTQLGLIGSFSAFDSDYKAILSYAITQGYTLPSEGQQELQNQLVVDLKSLGIWNKLDTLAIFATDGSSDFALIDWKKLSQYTAFNSPTFSTNGGFAGNGTSSYVNSQFSASIGVNYTLNSASRFYWIDNRSASTILEGLDISSGNNSFNNSSQSHIINSSNTAFTGSAVNFAVDGWHSVCRVDASNIALFTSTNRFDRVSASVGLVIAKQVIGKRASSFTSTRFRVFGCGGNLATENTDFYNAINTYLTSI